MEEFNLDTNPEFGYVLLSDQELADKLNMGIQTLKKRNNDLIRKGYLDIITIDGKEIKRFHLRKLSDHN